MGQVAHIKGWSHTMPDILQVKAWNGGSEIAVGSASRVRCERVDAKAELEVPPEYYGMHARIAADYDVSTNEPMMTALFVRLYTPSEELKYR